LLVRVPATLAVAAALISPPLATTSAHADGGATCGTATTPAATLTCAEQVFATAAAAVKTAQAPGGVSVTVPGVTIETSLFDFANETIAQAAQAAQDCLSNPNSICKVTVRTTLLDFVNQLIGQAVQEAGNCLAQTDPTCALVIRTAQQEAQAITTMATTCLSGTNATCNNLEQLVTTEIAAVLTLANQCVGGQDPTCSSLLSTVSQLLGEAVTCAVGPLGPGAPSTLPNPLVLPGSSAGDGSGLPDLTVTCQQVKNAAAQLLATCGPLTAPNCGVGIPGIDVIVKSPCLNTSDPVACAQTTVAPPTPVQTDVDPETIFPTNELRGRVVLGTGVGAAGVPVDFYVAPTMSDAVVVTPHLLGSTTTDATGGYVITISPDTYATSLASTNNGILNVLISAAVNVTVPGTVDPPVFEVAEGQTPLVLGGSAEYWESQPPTLLLRPAGQTDLSAPPAADLTAADPTDASVDPSINYLPAADPPVPAFQGLPVGADPFVVNGIDYRQAMPITGGGGCEPPKYRPYQESYTQIGDPVVKNVVVGETHAYWDATAEFVYGETADTETETGFSSDDATGWVSGSYNHVANSNSGPTSGLSPHGPFWAHQILVNFQIKNWKIKYTCYGSDKVYYTYEVSTRKCLFRGATGKDVSKYDGGERYAYSNQNWRDYVNPGYGLTIHKGTAYHYTNSWNAFGFYGKSVSGHSTNVEQKITALDSTAARHDIWGSNKAPYDNPAIMYSY